MTPHGVMFHHFHSDRHPRGQGAVSAAQLADMIGFLGRSSILPAQEWMDRAARGTLRDTDLCLTFDDNLRCQYDVARPVLDDLGLTALWFVSTCVLRGEAEYAQLDRRFRDTRFPDMEAFYAAFFDLVAESAWAEETQQALKNADTDAYLADYAFYSDADRRFRYARDEILGPTKYRELMDTLIRSSGTTVEALTADLWMDEACLKQLHAAGHVVGMHSHTHPTRLARLDPAAQEAEYRANRDCLTELLGQPPRVMSHPCNSYTVETLRILRRLGVTLGFRANMTLPDAGALEYPREDHTNILNRMRS